MSLGEICVECHQGVFFQLSSVPSSLSDFTMTWLMAKGPLPSRLIIFLFAGFTWALWTSRNEMAISKKFPKSPTDVIYIALSFMQKWSVNLKEKDQDCVAQLKNAVMSWIKGFKLNPILMSDVVKM